MKAADWFTAATHKAFQRVAPSNQSKCYRKAALCHIQQGEYAKATTIIRRCPENEAATHYISLLAAVQQGSISERIDLIQMNLLLCKVWKMKVMHNAHRRTAGMRAGQLMISTAIASVHGIVKAPDYDRNMLLLATQLSNESKMRTLLLSTLEALLQTFKARDSSSDSIVEAITLSRCIIKLIQSLLSEPAANL
jgi:hypothetical protein